MTTPRDQSLYYRRSRFTTHLPTHYRYSPAHYWLDERSPGVWHIGFTRFATRMLGDMVEIDFTVEPESVIEVGQQIGMVEGMKAVTSVFAVGTGRFLGGNEDLRRDITLVESDPYRGGWLYRLAGEPAMNTVDVQGYVAHLDITIDSMLNARHADDES